MDREMNRTFTAVFDPAKPLFRDMAKVRGWELVSDAECWGGELTLQLVGFLRPGEKWVSGTVMIQRARELGANLGQRHAEALLEYPNQIPETFRGLYLIFPGTVWQGVSGRRHVPYLSWDGGRWYLDFYGLEFNCCASDRFLCSRE